MDAALTKSERETLKAIWRITSQVPGDVASEPSGARTGDLAASLKVSPGAMTATVKKLADRRLVVHTPYHGVCLTDDGRRLAIAVVRRHRIVERLLADFLGYTWAEADRLAVAFEHSLPQEVEDRLFLALDRPTTCPHGFVIPGSGTDDLPTMPPLYDLGPGDRAVVALPGSTDAEVADFLEDLGVRPGVELRILDKQPFGGPMIVSVGGHERMLGENLARLILVHRVREQLPGATAIPQGSVTAPARAGEVGFIQQSETNRKDPAGDAIRR
jgi:DtxR family Mn-dependent transcriptional regulator